VRTTEFRWAVIAFAGVLMLGTLRGILVAIAASLLAIMHQANNPPLHEIGRKRGTHIYRPRSEEHPGDETWAGLLVLRPEGRLYFANAEHVSDRMREAFEKARPGVVIIDMRAVIDIEYTALMMLTAGEEKLRGQGVELWLAAMNPQVHGIVRDAALGKRLGPERMFASLQGAVQAYEARALAHRDEAA
jgi:MFS superfamily sulfate permease-like transporter